MRIAFLGATSLIAQNLVLSFATNSKHELVLFARRPEAVTEWLTYVDLYGIYQAHCFDKFIIQDQYDAIINFVGVANPNKAVAMGASIFDVTLQYDELALTYIQQHPTCRYIFLSSGAAYGATFESPVSLNSKAVIDINNLQPHDWYGVAKLHAECRHRSLSPLPIVDIRVFNYFSYFQDTSARFLITDILHAINHKTILMTSADLIVRDFIHPSDFCNLINAILEAPATNTVVDCYSKKPIDKLSLLKKIQEKFGLKYEITKSTNIVNSTGSKPHYYSLNKSASDFGYQPTHSSLDGVIKELQSALEST